MSCREFVGGAGIERDLGLVRPGLQLQTVREPAGRQVGQGRWSRTIEFCIYGEVVRTRRQFGGQLHNKFFLALDLQGIFESRCCADGRTLFRTHLVTA